MNSTMKIIREVNNQAEDFYSEAVGLGDHAAYAFRSPNPSQRNSHRSQLTSLENIAESAMKTSDVFDYIKKQTGREANTHWRRAFPEDKKSNLGFGERLKAYLEKDLPPKITIICESAGIGNVTDKDQQQRREIYLLLMRQFIRQMVVQYEYRLNPDKGNQERKP